MKPHDFWCVSDLTVLGYVPSMVRSLCSSDWSSWRYGVLSRSNLTLYPSKRYGMCLVIGCAGDDLYKRGWPQHALGRHSREGRGVGATSLVKRRLRLRTRSHQGGTSGARPAAVV